MMFMVKLLMMGDGSGGGGGGRGRIPLIYKRARSLPLHANAWKHKLPKRQAEEAEEQEDVN